MRLLYLLCDLVELILVKQSIMILISYYLALSIKEEKSFGPPNIVLGVYLQVIASGEASILFTNF